MQFNSRIEMIITYIDSEFKKALLNVIPFWVRSSAFWLPLYLNFLKLEG